MGKFAIGDTVVALRDMVQGNRGILRGTTGVVVYTAENDYTLGVSWDVTPNQSLFHDCGGRCPHGTGYYIYGDNMRLLTKVTPDPIVESEMKLEDLIL